MSSVIIKKSIICVVSVFLFIVCSLSGILLYDRSVYTFKPTPDLHSFVEQTYTGYNITDEIELTGIILFGITGESGGYKVLGFLNSPISPRYKMTPIEYDAKDYNRNGLLCMLEVDRLTYSFELYEGTMENYHRLNMQMPHYSFHLGIDRGNYVLQKSLSDGQSVPWTILQLQLAPYAAIVILFFITWFVIYKIVLRKITKESSSSEKD